MSDMDIETKNTVTNNTGDAASVADQDKNPETPQWQGLRRVPDKLPMIALLILVVEVRAVAQVVDYNLLTFVSAWRKIYLLWIVRSDAKLHQVSTADKTRALRTPDADEYSNPYNPESDLPGALGKGQAVATALGNFFKFWAYASTVIGAIIAGNIYLYQEIGQQTDILQTNTSASTRLSCVHAVSTSEASSFSSQHQLPRPSQMALVLVA